MTEPHDLSPALGGQPDEENLAPALGGVKAQPSPWDALRWKNGRAEMSNRDFLRLIAGVEPNRFQQMYMDALLGADGFEHEYAVALWYERVLDEDVYVYPRPGQVERVFGQRRAHFPSIAQKRELLTQLTMLYATKHQLDISAIDRFVGEFKQTRPAALRRVITMRKERLDEIQAEVQAIAREHAARLPRYTMLFRA